MATIAAPQNSSIRGNTRFFTIMAFVMGSVILAGFSLNLAMGRSSFDAPLAYHVHALIFMGWIGIYLAQHVTASAQNWKLHASFGKIAYIWIPMMVFAGCMIMIVVARRTGGPFFFDVNELRVSNLVGILTFGGLAWWALRRQRYNGWHRRLMLVSMSFLTGPGIGSLLRLPLLIPNAWIIIFCVTLLFPIIGMIEDKRKLGHVHLAYWWGTGIVVETFVGSMLVAYSPLRYAFTEWVIAGSAGAERPMQAFVPPDFD